MDKVMATIATTINNSQSVKPRCQALPKQLPGWDTQLRIEIPVANIGSFTFSSDRGIGP